MPCVSHLIASWLSSSVSSSISIRFIYSVYFSLPSLRSVLSVYLRSLHFELS
jgi:hypothetical protein